MVWRSLKNYHLKVHLLGWIVIVAIFASCSSVNNYVSTTLTASTYPTNFLSNIKITDFSNQNYDFKKALCMTVNERLLWETNNQFDKLDKHLKSTLRVDVDGEYRQLVTLSLPQIAVFHGVYDQSGKNIGTYGEPFDACFDVSDISTGDHRVSIYIESLSGVKYAFSLNINI